MASPERNVVSRMRAIDALINRRTKTQLKVGVVLRYVIDGMITAITVCVMKLVRCLYTSLIVRTL